MDDLETTESVQCAKCGSNLAPGTGVRDVTCAYCGVTQPHPVPYATGQEVLVPASPGPYQIGTVRSCKGPDAIAVEVGGRSTPFRVEALLPVLYDPAQIVPGARAYARFLVGWAPTWVVSADDTTAVVKNPEKAFQDAFFDKQVPLADVRLPARPEKRARRSRLAIAWQGLSLFNVAVGGFILLVALFIGGAFLLPFFRSLF